MINKPNKNMFNKYRPAKLPYISRFSFICYTLFFILSLFSRFLFLAGDEPDYFYRVSQVRDSLDSINYLHPYHYFSILLPSIPIHPRCIINATPLGFHASFSGAECVNDVSTILNRLLLLSITSLVFIAPTIFRRAFFYFFSRVGVKISAENYGSRCDAVSVSCLLPSSIYYLGVISLEQFSYCLILTSFLVLDSWLILPLVLWMSVADLGNTIVFAVFLVCFHLSKYVYKHLGIFKTMIILSSGSILAYIFSTSGLLILGKILPWATMFYEHYTKYYSELFDKYPIILRPIVTFLSFAFMTGSSIKPISVVYLFFALFFIINFKYAFRKLVWLKTYKDINQKQLLFECIGYLVSMFYIASIVFIFPTHGNYKYYMFFTPFFAALTLRFYQKNRKNLFKSKLIVYKIFLFVSAIVLLSLGFLFII